MYNQIGRFGERADRPEPPRLMVTNALQAAAAAAHREQRFLAAQSGHAESMGELPDKLGAIEAAAAVFVDKAVPYALIGGLAVGIRSGVPRATLDVDFAIATRIDRPWLRERLVEQGFSPTGSFAHSENFRHSTVGLMLRAAAITVGGAPKAVNAAATLPRLSPSPDTSRSRSLVARGLT
jgi:hypothetical protein